MAEEIVDRMKAEGQLIRNTGTNSIRAVRIQLDRFEDIFETISENISAQTQMMASMLDISADQLKMSEETAEREEARRQREELAADQTPTPRPDITRDDLPNKKTRESRGLFDLLKGGINLSKLLLGGAAAISGGIFAYNFLKGFIDEKTGGGFTRFEEGLIDTVQNIDFESIKDSFTLMKEKLLSIAENLEKIALFLENPFGALKDFDLMEMFNAVSLGVIANSIAKQKGVPLPVRALALLFAAGLYTSGGGERGESTESLSVTPEDAEQWEGLESQLEELRNRREIPDLNRKERRDLDTEIRRLEREQQEIEDKYDTGSIFEGVKGAAAEGGATGAAVGLTIPTSWTGLGTLPTLGISAAVGATVYTTKQILRNIFSPDNFSLNETPSSTSSVNNNEPDLIDGYRRGTKGFQDFGPASFAILHGREAVVPEETPAGRFLNQYFTNEWIPKMAPSSDLADRVSTAAGGTINMPIIVNNSPTVAPIVNNVQGGPNVTSTNVFGSGGSRSGTFGLSNAIN